MADTSKIKTTFERNKQLLKIKPSKGQYTTKTTIRLRDGTSCDVEHKHWKFSADIGKTEGGNDAGPGPGILQRGALGSCLAIGYAKWAAYLDIPITDLTVEVEADVDARGSYGIDDITPEHKGMRYNVIIESSAPEEKIREMIDRADKHSPLLADFKKPIKVEREVKIVKGTKKIPS